MPARKKQKNPLSNPPLPSDSEDEFVGFASAEYAGWGVAIKGRDGASPRKKKREAHSANVGAAATFVEEDSGSDLIEGGKFKCKYCPRVFPSQKGLSAHGSAHKDKSADHVTNHKVKSELVESHARTPKSKAGSGAVIHPYQMLLNMPQPCPREEHLRRKNCAANPWCIYGFSKEREEGMWCKEGTFSNRSEAPSSIRAVDTTLGTLQPPAGLKNLGATCYINALLQCLFQNLLFRDSLFNMTINDDSTPSMTASSNSGVSCLISSTDEKSQMQKVLRSLQTAFAHMDKSCKSVYDIEDFVRLLGLPTNIQQDPEEFAKLFLEKISEMEIGSIDRSREGAKALFTGREIYHTICEACGHLSKREQTFQEIEVPIDKGSLEKALGTPYLEEKMTGDNRYHCEKCNGLQDAVRSRHVLTAPTVLLVRLMRYYYDKKKWMKEKHKTKMTFPDSLIFGGEDYTLTAVLYHIGPGAYEGHYVCDALEWTTNQWWSFDDTHVNKSVCPGTSADTVAAMSSEECPIIVDGSEATIPVGRKRKSTSKVANTIEAAFSSPKKLPAPYKVTNLNRASDTYMLVYVKTRRIKDSLRYNERLYPNSDIIESVAKISRNFEIDNANEFNSKKDLLDPVNQRKTFYNSIESTLPVIDPTDDFAVIPTNAFELFVSGARLKRRISQNLKTSNGSYESIDLTAPEAVSPSAAPMEVAEVITGEEKTNVCRRVSRPLVGKRSIDISSQLPTAKKASVSDSMYTESFNNAAMICKHNKGLDPAYLPKCKFISKKAFDKMMDKKMISMDVTFTAGQNNIICMLCFYDMGAVDTITGIANTFSQIVTAVESDVAQQLTLVSESVDESDRGNCLIPKAWFKELKKYSDKLAKQLGKGVAAGETPVPELGSIDPLINSKYSCKKHIGCANCLAVDTDAPPPSMHVISAGTWDLIRSRYADAVVIDSRCVECAREYQMEKSMDDIEVSKRKSQVDNSAMLHLLNRASGKNPKYHPPELDNVETFTQTQISSKCGSHEPFMLVQKLWLDKWRAYHNDLSVGSPGRIDNDCFYCVHKKTILPPVYVDITSGVSPSSVTFTDDKWYEFYDAEVVNVQQWQNLVEHFGVSSEDRNDDGVAIVDENDVSLSNSKNSKVSTTANGGRVFEVKLHIAASGSWEWSPDVCRLCVSEKRGAAMSSKRFFKEKELKVVLIEDGDTLPNEKIRAAFFNGNDVNDNNSSSQNRAVRSRRVTERSKQKSSPLGDKITVSSSEEICTIRLKIFALLDIQPASQEVYCGSNLLEDDKKTLGDYGILCTDIFYVRSTQPKQYTHRDGSIVPLKETGFTGTFLSSSLYISNNTSGSACGNGSSSGRDSSTQLSSSITIEDGQDGRNSNPESSVENTCEDMSGSAVFSV